MQHRSFQPTERQQGVTPVAGEDRARAELSVSAIIPTKNRPQDLALVTRSLLGQTVLPRQLVIIDQSENENGRRAVEMEFKQTAPRIRDLVALDYIRDTSISGLAVARNRSMKLAYGDIWLFLDDDVELELDFIEQLLKVYMQHPEAGGVGGVVTNYSLPSLPFRLWNRLFEHGPFFDERQPIYWNANRLRDAGPTRVRKLGGGLMSFRSALIRNLQFDSRLTGVCLAEDVDFCYRLPPTALLINPKARLVHKQNLVGRARDHWLRAHAQASYYLYRRNWSQGFKNKLCFSWLNVGYVAVVALSCARRVSLEPWRAFVDGVGRARAITAKHEPRQ